ncbi:MAG: hypothetical protein HW397_298, partial [Dehalococcoidia bacterium]|nr:hypothetical protein [Dehalococcoidia bacterium]
MPVAETWWRTTPTQSQPSARWFGVFRRRLPLRHGTPGLVSIPQCRIGEPRGLTWTGAAGNAATTDGGLLFDRANTASAFILALESSPASVSLAGVLPSADVPEAPAIGSDTPEKRLWRHLELAGDRVAGEGSAISLAKRLAYLLQPPADLLASATGPLEWH